LTTRSTVGTDKQSKESDIEESATTKETQNEGYFCQLRELFSEPENAQVPNHLLRH
jgi:hypothetical protein